VGEGWQAVAQKPLSEKMKVVISASDNYDKAIGMKPMQPPRLLTPLELFNFLSAPSIGLHRHNHGETPWRFRYSSGAFILGIGKRSLHDNQPPQLGTQKYLSTSF
jgi:hypothetical protein